MKILVVDDQPDVVAGILDGVNWRALHVEKAYSALSAAEAKDLLLREKIDILLCDIEMPGESGLSLVAWLQKQGRETKCIFLTAHADFPYAQKALQLGAVDYLLQPASYENIEAAIRRAAEQLQEERLSQVYEALGKSVERETLNFRRNVLREYLLEIRRGPKKVAEKAAAFGFLASSRAYRCTLIAVQEPGKNQIDDFLLYGIQNVLEELLQACTEQVTVLFLEQKIYLAILALADNPPEGAEQSIEQGLETLCRFGSRELHMGLSCYCSKDCVRFEGLPQEYQQLRRQHRQNVACSCGLILPKKQSTSSLKPEFPKWAGMLSQGLGDAVRSEIHSYLNQLNQEGGLTPETLFQFHEHFLPLFLGAMQHWEKDQDIFSKVDYDAIMQAYASLPQMLQFVDFVTEYVENSASKGKCQGRSQIERILSYIKNTLAALLFPSLMMNAFYVIMMRTYFTTNIPDAVIEAARIDGAGELRILSQVVMPMSIPIIATLALLAGLAYWNDWLNGLYYISDDRLFSIQVLLNRMLLDVQFLMSNSDAAKSLQQNEEFVLPSTGIRMAVAVMGALPILVVYPFFQKYFVKGIVIGAVKG